MQFSDNGGGGNAEGGNVIRRSAIKRMILEQIHLYTSIDGPGVLGMNS